MKKFLLTLLLATAPAMGQVCEQPLTLRIDKGSYSSPSAYLEMGEVDDNFRNVGDLCTWADGLSLTDTGPVPDCQDGESQLGDGTCYDPATQAELGALDTTDDDLSDNQLGDLSDVSEASADSGDALVSDGAGSWSPVDVLTPAEAAAAYCALTGCTLTGDLDLDGSAYIVVDADGDTTIESLSDDTLKINIGGSIGFTLDANRDATFRGAMRSFDGGKSSEFHPDTGLKIQRDATICWTNGSDYYSTAAACESKSRVITTTDATLTVLDSFAVASDTTITISCQVTARRTDADDESAAYQLTVLADNNAGTTAVVGTDAGYVIEDTAAWAVSASADDASDEIDIEVTGEGSKTISWQARCSTNGVTG